jgi:outer membrane protein assembly factor BamB
VEFNTDGTINHILTGVPQSAFLGMWTNPVNQHLIAASGGGLIDIDPLANGGLGSSRVIAAGVSADGVSVSPDGTTVYAEVGGTIQAFNITTGQLLHTYTGFNSPDGNGVITSSNNLNGKIIVNNNNGEVDLLDPVAATFVVIATGGTRGDYVSPDTSNGTLFMDYSDVVMRLSCGANCSIGAPPSSVPEPATMSLLGISLAGLGIIRRLMAR